MFDTHCHLNFSRFKKNVDEVVNRAQDVGVTHFVVPGTDIESSKRAIELSEEYENIFAAVGIHPHHVFNTSSYDTTNYHSILSPLLSHPNVVAVGEIGLDKHAYTETKYEHYAVTPEFFKRQKELFTLQLRLAAEFSKSVIIHNRETAHDVLLLLTEHWNPHFEGRMVFHCCEPNEKLLEFAKQHHIFIGVDGDVTYDTEKQEFVKKIPLELLVIETDSPFLLPEPLRRKREFPNEPKNIPLIISSIATLIGKTQQHIGEATTQNARKLFRIA